ncbi:MAG: lactococcin 972 family bacteriocin [Bifidobacteriaceae bacterium]|jgi:lactococcin 972 family bacteriocin|nr:lactococcin 972 family bacteriocin [Bifidobacteriaceae bacterium]
MRKVISSLLLAGVLAVGGAAIALANTTYPPEGGRWDWGVNDNCYSNYYHGSKTHGSTASSANGVDRSEDIERGFTSYAAVKASGSGNNAYYRVK